MISNKSTKMEIDNTNKDILELTDVKGSDFIKIDTIVRCQAIENMCTIFINNGNKHIVCKDLKEIEQMLPEHKFIKIHKSNIVNVDFVNNYFVAEKKIIMHDGTRLPISSNKKKLLEIFDFKA